MRPITSKQENDVLLKIDISTSARLVLRHGMKADTLWNDAIGELVLRSDRRKGVKSREWGEKGHEWGEKGRDWNEFPLAHAYNSTSLNVPASHVDIVRSETGYEPQEWLTHLLALKGLPNVV